MGSTGDGMRWAMRHLPFYARWFRFIMMYPGVGLGTERYRSDPDYDDGSGWAINESNAARRASMTEWITSLLDGRPDLIEKLAFRRHRRQIAGSRQPRRGQG